MSALKRKLPQKYDNAKMKKAVISLSEKGFSRPAIVRKLAIEDTMFFSRYKESADWYATGRDLLAADVLKETIAATKTSFLDRRLLIEKLGLLNTEPFEFKKEIKDQASARDGIALSIKLFAEGKISTEVLKTITTSLGQYIESVSQSKLQEDILELRRMMKGMKR